MVCVSQISLNIYIYWNNSYNLSLSILTYLWTVPWHKCLKQQHLHGKRRRFDIALDSALADTTRLKYGAQWVNEPPYKIGEKFRSNICDSYLWKCELSMSHHNPTVSRWITPCFNNTQQIELGNHKSPFDVCKYIFYHQRGKKEKFVSKVPTFWRKI